MSDRPPDTSSAALLDPPGADPNPGPAKAFVFILADEWDPFRAKLVRKVIFPTRLQNSPEILEPLLDPEKFGFWPRNMGSNTSLGRHVLGMTDSRFISTSRLPFGSPRFTGQRYWIDEAKLKAAGAQIFDAKDIVADLDRIASQARSQKNPAFLKYLDDIKQKSLVLDREAIVEGPIPGAVIKGPGAMAATRGLQFLQGVGIVLTIYDLDQAEVRSVRAHSVRALAAEAIRQGGGWGGALVGMRLGAAGGAMIGIETGPGALATGAIGGFIGGVIGFFGAGMVASVIDRPVQRTVPRTAPTLKFEDWDRPQ